MPNCLVVIQIQLNTSKWQLDICMTDHRCEYEFIELHCEFQWLIAIQHELTSRIKKHGAKSKELTLAYISIC